jgi:CubicO group peptidase (beta-lactamase class C family)
VAIDDVLAEVDRLVDAFVTGEPVPGVAYGVIVDGELVHTRGVGTTAISRETPPTADTVFRIASMTKNVVATGSSSRPAYASLKKMFFSSV